MKKRLLNIGLCVVALLLTGAVAVTAVDQLVIEPLIVDSLGGLVEKYIQFREQYGPIVPPTGSYSDASESM